MIKTIPVAVAAFVLGVMLASVLAADYVDARGIRHWNHYQDGGSHRRLRRHREARQPTKRFKPVREAKAVEEAPQHPVHTLTMDPIAPIKPKPCELVYADIADIEAKQNAEMMHVLDKDDLKHGRLPPWVGIGPYWAGLGPRAISAKGPSQ